MAKIYISAIGLEKGHMSLKTAELIDSGALAIILQSERCYLFDELKGKAATLDNLFDNAEDFDELNQAIALELCEKAAISNVLFLMLDAPEAQKMLISIKEECKARAIEMQIIPSVGLKQAVINKAMDNGYIFEPLSYRYAHEIEECSSFDISRAQCILELDRPITASNIKLALMEYYDDEQTVIFCNWIDKQFDFFEIPLYELDRQNANFYKQPTCIIIDKPKCAPKRKGIVELSGILERLRGADGCPWDAEQTHLSLRASLIEEVYELVEAIECNDDDMMIEELGDLLMLILFNSCIAKEQSRFSLRDVSTAISNKLIYRHPHVFKDKVNISSGEVLDNWDELKRKEKDQKDFSDVLESIPKTFPALTRCQKLLSKLKKNQSEIFDVLIEEASKISINRENMFITEQEFILIMIYMSAVAKSSNIDAELALNGAISRFIANYIGCGNNEKLDLDIKEQIMSFF